VWGWTGDTWDEIDTTEEQGWIPVHRVRFFPYPVERIEAVLEDDW